MRCLLFLLLATTACNSQAPSAGATGGPVSVTIQPADQAMIPWSTRSVYADVEGTKNLGVNWTATGGCSLAQASTNAAPEVVIAGDKGGKCQLTREPWSNERPSFKSTVMCKVTATSAADATKSASIVLPVCAPPVELSTFPQSAVLFKGQYAVVQSDLRGSVTTGVTWAITANPGGAGTLAGGASNRHAVFSANAAGTYVVTATSVADAHKTASTTIYVTGNSLPPANADHTEQIDCTAVGKSTVYEVGPERAYKDLNAVPWLALKPGATVRVHNDDTTGSAPTTYHQHITIAATGTASLPLRICGVPDARGVKPIVDGENASTAKGVDWVHTSLEDLGVIMIYDGVHKWDTKVDGQQNVLIEGLHVRNARPSFHFLQQSDGTSKAYSSSVSCVHVHTGHGVVVRGNDLENCAQAVFTNSQLPEGGIISDLTIEGNYIHEWGQPNFDRDHAMYLQAIGLVTQFNYFGAAAAGVNGNVIKSRSVMNFLRWNFVSQTLASTARSFDLVEPQNYTCYVIPHGYEEYFTPGSRIDCYPPHDGPASDPMTADVVAGNFEAYHSDYVYGNVVDDAGSESSFVHYGYDQQTDHGPYYDRRGGTLYYWNNTHLDRTTNEYKVIFDSAHPDTGHSYEFPSIESVNNVFGMKGSSVFLWTMPLWARVVVDSNWTKAGTLLPNRDAKDTYQGGVPAASRAGCGMYERCKQGNGHMEWQRGGVAGTAASTLYIGATPFDVSTYLPDAKLRGLGAPLPKAIRDQLSNMEYLPATNVITVRKDAAVLGALE